MDDHEMIILC